MIGQNISHYQIVAKLGEGGMGEVYLAEDTELKRQVALKFLPRGVASDPAVLERFRREARAAAALNHSNIVTIHEIGTHDGQPFIVMAHVEGQTLRKAIDRGDIPLDRALDLVVQIGEGLSAAHAAGVIHRDVKPENIILDGNGKPQILDFGLAKLHGATVLTQEQSTVGTIFYMSPEQARGVEVDSRSDIFSVGVVAYELIAGQRPFRGDHREAVLYSITSETPQPLVRYNRDATDELERIVGKMLAKDPAERYQTMGDALVDLKAVRSNASGYSPTPGVLDVIRAAGRAIRPALPWLAAAAAIIAAFVAGRVTTTPVPPPIEPEPPRVVRSSITLPEGVQLDGSGTPVLALSPDASTLAFVGREGGKPYLFLRHMETGKVVRVPDSYAAEGPFFSPDGKWVAFANGVVSGIGIDPPRLRKAPVDGGPTQVVCGILDYFGGFWREDGTIFWVDALPGDLWRVDDDGGKPIKLAPDIGGLTLLWPRLLPDGSAALAIDYIRRPIGAVVRVDLDSGQVTDLELDGSMVWPLPTGHVLVSHASERELLLQRFQLSPGIPRPGQALAMSGISLTRNNGVAAALSVTGTIVYSTGPVMGSRRELTELAWLDYEGNIEPLDLPPDRYGSIDLSPDGKRLATQIDGNAVWIIDLARGTRLRLPSGDVFDQAGPLWVPDGTRVVWTGWGGSNSAGSANLYVQAADGVSPPRRIEQRVGEFWARSWIPGTETLLDDGWSTEDRGRTAMSTVRLDGSRKPEVLMRARGINSLVPSVRPDGRWIAYNSDEGGENFVYVLSFPDLARKIPVAPAEFAHWSADGDRLIIGDRSGRIRVVEITDSAGGLKVGAEREIARIEDYRDLCVDPLGRGLLVVHQQPGTGTVTELHLVQGWFEEVKKLLPPR